MTTTAWRLLQQEMRLTSDEAKTLTILLTGNPVALTGHEAMVPLSDLLPDSPDGDRWQNVERRQDKIRQMMELLQRSWRFHDAAGNACSFPFVTGCSLANESKFLRYTLNRNLLSYLMAIKATHAIPLF
jgi:hypothetical protein